MKRPWPRVLSLVRSRVRALEAAFIGVQLELASREGGLGLSIAKAIVERHHGSIGVTSVPGRAAFTIVLPHQSAEPAPHSTSTNL